MNGRYAITWPRSVVAGILAGAAVSLFILVGIETFSPGLLSGERRLAALETRFDDLAKSSSLSKMPPALESRLQQDENNINNLKSQAPATASSQQEKELLDEVRKEIAEARSQTDRTEHVTNISLALYAIITGLLIGDGLISKSRLEKQINEAQGEAEKKQEAVEVANKEMSSKLEEALKRTEATEQALVDKTASLDAFITTRRSALFEAVPTFIDQQLSNEQPLDPAFRDPMQFARTDEIDHLTFYSASFRFRPPETDDEREIYLKALIATCRHQIIKGSPGAALNRLELFFKFEKATDKSAHASRMRAQAYSLRARAYYSLLDLRIKFKPVTPDAELKSDLQGYRREIEKNLRLAKEADFLWALSHQYQALYLSLAPVDEDIPISDRPAVQLENQRLAIEIYQMLLDRHADFTPNSCNTARRNIGCCHKRIGDSTGDYSGQFAVLRSFPKESEIAKNAAIYHPATHPDAFSRYFWHEMISDGVLFESLGKPEKLAEYQGEWVALLSEKMDISAPRQAYENLFEKFPEYRNWAVKPWTLL